MTTELLLASRNAKKLVELRRIVGAMLPGLRVLGLDDVPPYDEVPESGATFAENALLKAREAVRRTGLPAVGDDSGLTVGVLGGMPGIFSARWAGRHGDDRANLELLLGQLADVPDGRLDAAFVCAAALVAPGGDEHVVHGTMPGHLIRQPRGQHGFGYDPIFVPEGTTLTAAELPAARKDAISHRGHAFAMLAPVIARVLQLDDAENEQEQHRQGS